MNQTNIEPDVFFETVADSLVKTILLIAIASPYPDLLMVYALLVLPNLAQRIAFATDVECKDLWLSVPATTSLTARVQCYLLMNKVCALIVRNAQTALMQPQLVERITYADLMLPDPNLTSGGTSSVSA